jgi:DNA-binding Lrp family transcriptional regulator
MKQPKLDQMDRKILLQLDRDCRRSLGQIAKAVGCSKQTLHYRVQRLEKEDVIVRYIAAIDIRALGYSDYEVWMQLRETSLDRKKEFMEFLVSHPRVRWVASCGGKYDVALMILAQDANGFMATFKQIVRRYPGIVKDYIISTLYEFHRYTRSHLVSGETKKELYSYSKSRSIELDKEDMALLSVLSEDARAPTMAMAKRAGISPNTVRAKKRRLEDEGVLKAYSIAINGRKAGFTNQDILISLHNMSEQKEKELDEYCLQNKRIIYMNKVIGKWDLYISYDSYSEEDFQAFLTEFRTRFADVIKDYELMNIIEDMKFRYLPELETSRP